MGCIGWGFVFRVRERAAWGYATLGRPLKDCAELNCYIKKANIAKIKKIFKSKWMQRKVTIKFRSFCSIILMVNRCSGLELQVLICSDLLEILCLHLRIITLAIFLKMAVYLSVHYLITQDFYLKQKSLFYLH